MDECALLLINALTAYSDIICLHVPNSNSTRRTSPSPIDHRS